MFLVTFSSFTYPTSLLKYHLCRIVRSCECIEMDDNIQSAINQASDKFASETVAQDAGKHPELSILFKFKRCGGAPLPPFLLTCEDISAMCDKT